MKLTTLESAMVEAKRFLQKAEAAKHRMLQEKHYDYVVSKETAACKRASLDLSRALSELRKP